MSPLLLLNPETVNTTTQSSSITNQIHHVSSFNDVVRNIILNTIHQYEFEYNEEDILRHFRDESILLYETQQVRTTFIRDPYDLYTTIKDDNDDDDDDKEETGKTIDSRLEDNATKYNDEIQNKKERNERIRNSIFQLTNSLQVIDYHKVMTLDGYCSISATVFIPTSCMNNIKSDKQKQKKKMKKNNESSIIGQKNKNSDGLRLTFCYERNAVRSIVKNEKSTFDNDDVESSSSSPNTLQYTIDISKDCGKREKLLWIQLYTNSKNDPPSYHQNVQNLLLVMNHNNDNNIIIDDCNELNILDKVKEKEEDVVIRNDDDDITHDENMKHINTDNDDKEDDDDKDIVSLTRYRKRKRQDDKMKESDHKRYNNEKHQINEKDEVFVVNDSKYDKYKDNEDDVNEDDDNVDGYIAGMDPDVLDSFRTSISQHLIDNIDDIDDITLFYFFMTFPFYEQEWDIVNFLHEGIFDDNNSDDIHSSEDDNDIRSSHDDDDDDNDNEK